MTDWQRWLQAFGLHVPASPDVDSIAIACVAVLLAYALGWLAAVRGGPVLGRLAQRWAGRGEGVADGIMRTLLRFGVPALLLTAAGNLPGLSPVAAMIVAAALGFAVALLVYRLARCFGLGQLGAIILLLLTLLGTTAAALGGMRPLLAGLDAAGFVVGKTRLSLLGLVDFIAVAAALLALARLGSRVVNHSIERMTALDPSQKVLAQKLAGIAIIAVAVLIGVDVLGIDLTALTVFSGAVGLAVGFGLQKTFGNLIAGLILLMDRSIKPGDVIVVGDSFGQVNRIGVRAVSVVTRDGKEHLIPNEKLMTDPVENWSYTNRNVRLHIPVGIAYGSDLPLAQRLMMEAGGASRRVLPEPAPSVWLRRFGDSAIEHDILVWIADPELGVGNVQSEILNRLWALFQEHGIEVPFPQMDVRLRREPE